MTSKVKKKLKAFKLFIGLRVDYPSYIKPSNKIIEKKIKTTLINVADKCLEVNLINGEVKDVLINSIGSLSSIDFDSGERELIADYYAELSEILSINIHDEIDVFQYGRIVEGINNKEKDQSFLEKKCSSCNNKMGIFYSRRQNNLKESGLKVKVNCLTCQQENNFLLKSNPKNISLLGCKILI